MKRSPRVSLEWRHQMKVLGSRLLHREVTSKYLILQLIILS